MKRPTQSGFTLYELLITLLVVGVILAIGVPNLSGFTKNSRVTGVTNDLHGSFLLARSEAARAKQNVTICASSNPFAAEPACGGGATFADGWIIFVDLDRDDDRDVGSDEHVLKSFPPVDDAIHVNTNTADRFSFASTGLGAGGGPFIAMICDDRGNTVAPGGESAARRIVVTPVGRSTIIRSQDTIAASVGSLGVTC
ncbi:MAG TPA: GspH/FimT family pseudopilin [Woeseiaceae bacterium]|nr:GspH/FimT family pseudopilin [Woeseiaceae bacterium]